ncbi:MAG: 2-dehydropantoate 2-reductase [Deferribacteres bacterium]|nr:2-dehydropantoate 2-reductase [candidate division KSB1 bacterium]MCB9501679.1 2-dehydropantoate 2-reductase [Deferribacteres bacterium]
MKNKLQITIFGTGAMASLFAARMIQHQNQTGASYWVRMFGHWQAQIDKIANDGLRVIEQDGTYADLAIPITGEISDITDTKIALVCVKSFQTEAAAKEIEKILRDDGIAVTLQNGFGNEKVLEEKLGHQRVTRAITTQGAALTAPGILHYAGGGETMFAKHAAKMNVLSELVQILNSSELPARFHDNFEHAAWQKLIVNAVINPLTALARVRNGELPMDPILLKIMKSIVKESVQVANSQGFDFISGEMLQFVRTVCNLTAHNHSSMLQDVVNSRPTEIDAISGAIVRYGRAAKIATPVNQKVVEIMSNTQLQKTSLSEMNNMLLDALNQEIE